MKYIRKAKIIFAMAVDIYNTIIVNRMGIQEYVNRRFFREGCGHIHWNRLMKNMGFTPKNMNYTIFGVMDEYDFGDIKPTDIVLDIGANLGFFSMLASRKARQVYSIEPLMTKQLIENIEANDIKNIKVFETALGDGSNSYVYWDGHDRTIETKPLPELIQMCGGHVDFLKCDAEYYEWYIKPGELKGIRRIEMEVHNTTKKHSFEKFDEMLIKDGFEFSKESIFGNSFLYHINVIKR